MNNTLINSEIIDLLYHQINIPEVLRFENVIDFRDDEIFVECEINNDMCSDTHYYITYICSYNNGNVEFVQLDFEEIIRRIIEKYNPNNSCLISEVIEQLILENLKLIKPFGV